VVSERKCEEKRTADFWESFGIVSTNSSKVTLSQELKKQLLKELGVERNLPSQMS
jgi:hypothetical protein